jgi:hypothetical protein
MSIIGKLFGSSTVVTAGINAIDSVVFTEQEKSEHKITLLKAYEPFKIAQRFLALIYGIPYALGWAIAFVASFWLDVSAQIEMLSGDMGLANTLILGFYFGGGAVESFFKGKAK